MTAAVPPPLQTTTIRSSPYGPVVIAWRGLEPRGATIVRVFLSSPDGSAIDRASAACPAASEASCAEIDAVASGIREMLGGEPVDFRLDLVDLTRCGAFQRRVLDAEHAVPRGRVSTYGLIAAHLGVPRGARAVGAALATNPFPLIVPCHRAVRSDGTLGGFQGGTAMKRALLESEGVALDASGRVDRSCVHYG